MLISCLHMYIYIPFPIFWLDIYYSYSYEAGKYKPSLRTLIAKYTVLKVYEHICSSYHHNIHSKC